MWVSELLVGRFEPNIRTRKALVVKIRNRSSHLGRKIELFLFGRLRAAGILLLTIKIFELIVVRWVISSAFEVLDLLNMGLMSN